MASLKSAMIMAEDVEMKASPSPASRSDVSEQAQDNPFFKLREIFYYIGYNPFRHSDDRFCEEKDKSYDRLSRSRANMFRLSCSVTLSRYNPADSLDARARSLSPKTR